MHCPRARTTHAVIYEVEESVQLLARKRLAGNGDDAAALTVAEN